LISLVLSLVLSLAALQGAASGRITGQVVEAAAGAPLAAVLVKVSATGQRALSDADGRFEIPDVPAGRQALLVSVVGYGLVRRDVEVLAGEATEVAIAVAGGAAGYVEAVTVGSAPFTPAESGVASQALLGSRDLLALRGVMADDPFRAVQVLPTVAAGDDFTAEFAVRGLGPTHVGIALDGIDSPLLFHTVRGVEDTGSLALINSDVLQSASLLSGAYPQVAGSHLGSRLDVTTRDGARDRLTARGLVSGTAASTVWEGPLGTGRRGSWIVAARRSYIDWLLRQVDPTIDSTFGFTDGQGKVTLDLSSRQTLQVQALGGRSLLRGRDATPGLNALDRAHTRTVIGSLAWRFTPSDRALVRQQVYLVKGRYRNSVPDGRVREEGTDRDVTWRGSAEVELARGSGRGVSRRLEIGGQVRAERAVRVERTYVPRGVSVTLDRSDAHTDSAAWALLRWTASPSLSLQPGVRVDRFGSVDRLVLSPWLLSEWQSAASWRVRASAGRQHQAPRVEQVFASAAKTLAPEETMTYEAGVERRVQGAWRVSVTGYVRQDDRRLRHVNAEYLLRSGGLVRPSTAFWQNTLDGLARGVETLVERRVTNGVSGWVSYAYGRSRLRDASTGETFTADYDQTHTLNAYAIYRRSSATGLSARFRYGSNVPIQGYFARSGTTYTVGATRNAERLPAYARLDLRADRAFTYRRSRLTLFVEVINTLGRRNLGPADWSLNTTTLVYRNVTETLFPLLPSAGLLIEF